MARRQSMQGGFVFAQPALLNDRLAAAVQVCQRRAELLPQALLKLGLRQLLFRRGAAVFQVPRGAEGLLAGVVVEGAVEGRVAGAKALLHLHHFLGFHA